MDGYVAEQLQLGSAWVEKRGWVSVRVRVRVRVMARVRVGVRVRVRVRVRMRVEGGELGWVLGLGRGLGLR